MADCMAMTNFGEDMSDVNFIVPSKLGEFPIRKKTKVEGPSQSWGCEGRDNRVALGDPVLGDPHIPTL